MGAFRSFLKDVFTVRTVWVDQGAGHWVTRRRLHPLMRLLLWGGAAALCLSAGLSWMEDGKPREQESPVLTVPEPAPSELLGPAETPEGGEDIMGPEDEGPEDLVPEREPLPVPEPGSARDYWIRISKGDYTLSLYRGDELVRTYSVAVGKNPGNKRRAGDHRTPVGTFRVRSVENSSAWKHDFRDGRGVIAGAYGPWFIRLATGWKGIGIHGTHAPESRGTMATEGCIRMSNEEVRELKPFVFRNMKVVIEE